MFQPVIFNQVGIGKPGSLSKQIVSCYESLYHTQIECADGVSIDQRSAFGHLAINFSKQLS